MPALHFMAGFLFMKKIILLSLLILAVAGKAASQEKIYYDKFFHVKADAPTAFVRHVERKGSNIFITDVGNDTIRLKGFVSSCGPDLLRDMVRFIKNEGNKVNDRAEFDTMKAELDFYSKGKLQRKLVSYKGKVLYGQIWNNEGVPLLQSGTGEHRVEKGDATIYELYKDSVVTESYEVRRSQQDTLFSKVDRIAEPEEGFQPYLQSLVTILKYPALVQLAGKEGLVYVQFIVNKEGKLTEFKPLTNEGFNFEKKVIDKLSNLPPWKPAMLHGKPVKMRFTLPVKFKLT